MMIRAGLPGGGDAPGGLDAVDLRHAHVHQHHIGRLPVHELHRLEPVARLAHHLDVLLVVEDHAKPAPHEGLVVGDRHPHGHAEDSSGSRAWTR